MNHLNSKKTEALLLSHPFSLEKNRWIYLAVFFLANAYISYGDAPPQTQWMVGLFGILLPLYVGLRTASPPPRGEKPSFGTDLKLSPPVWLLAGALFLAVILRFYKLETLFRWPTLDEGWNGTLAIELSKHWSWKFFYTFGEAPPLPVWCAALLFKCGFSSAFCLWFPSAIVSLLTAAAGTFAARRFFSNSLALVCGGLLAFSTWPLYIGRFCHQGIWIPLWVCLCLNAWGSFCQASGEKIKRNRSIVLGIILGLGSFTFTPWLGVAAFFFCSITWGMIGSPKKDFKNFYFFGGAFLFALLPFLSAVLTEGYGRHILSLSPWGGWFKGFHMLEGFAKYFAVLLWGSYEQDPAYTPLWGGFLNPLLGSFFFSGVLELFRLRRLILIRWAALTFFLFLLPGALSPNLETFRIAQELPLLLFIAALGLHSFLSSLPPQKRLAVFVSVLALTGLWDFNLLTAPYREPDAHPEIFGRPLKSLERYRAWLVLNDFQAKRGPGFILTDFDDDSFNDPTLSVMTYPFNASRNSALLVENPGWIGVFANIHYKPFLEKNFHDGQWLWVGKNLSLENGGNMLGLLTAAPLHQPALNQWTKAHAFFQEADNLRFSQIGEDFDPILRLLETAYPAVHGEPFLESVYWNKRAAYEYKKFNYDQHLLSYQMAVTRGYPTAELYYKVGLLLLEKGRDREAEVAFRKATLAPLDLTEAQTALDWLKAHPDQVPAAR